MTATSSEQLKKMQEEEKARAVQADSDRRWKAQRDSEHRLRLALAVVSGRQNPLMLTDEEVRLLSVSRESSRVEVIEAAETVVYDAIQAAQL